MVDVGSAAVSGSELDADKASRDEETCSGHTSDDIHRNDGFDGWAAATLSIGTFGVREGSGPKSRHGSDGPWTTAGADELDGLQEFRLLVRAKGVVTGAEDDEGSSHHRRSLSRTSSSTNGREVAKLKQRSLRKIMAGAFNGFLHRPSCSETMSEASVSEIIWSLLHKNTHPVKPSLPEPMISGDTTVQTPQEEEGSKWIRTDSECKFMFI
ncbi:hypothetical protein E2562_009488 [Oryza meyeriana var. granulata]|uniref:Uncharacterized protein n=1 Tax=Oryza meyeriana var. granulata TaxID=110450 RepID=A0A6G1BSJ6_9ORYZ|nr:hypothetical protein E2562_009488 [Oryza meyeriana var. granulata]